MCNIYRNHGKNWTEVEKHHLISEKKRGASFEEIASYLGRTVASVENKWYTSLKDQSNNGCKEEIKRLVDSFEEDSTEDLQLELRINGVVVPMLQGTFLVTPSANIEIEHNC